MNGADHVGGGRFRVWITQYDRWQPEAYGDVPPAAVALEPAENDLMSAAEAAIYVEAFNREALRRPQKIWAIAVPVTFWIAGEPDAGVLLRDLATAGAQKSPPRVC